MPSSRREAGIDRQIRFGHRVVGLEWAHRRGPLARHRRAHGHRRDRRADLGTQAIFHVSKRWPELVKRQLRRAAARQLPAGYDVDTHFTPGYDPWDQRLCLAPDGDLFAAIREGRASVVTDHLDTFTEKGVRLRSGDELEADVVITATGLELLFLGGMRLAVDGEDVDVAQRLTYLRDHRAMNRRRVDDDALVFSNPVPPKPASSPLLSTLTGQQQRD